MSKSNWYIFVLIFTLYSCDYFIRKKENREDIFKTEWDKLSLNEVDEPPLFINCKDEPTEELRSCFRNTITKHLHNSLKEYTISTKEAIHDTIWIPLLITKEGKIFLENFKLPNILKTQLPDFRNLLEKSIHTLPEIKPAHTRSTPVTTRYKLPLVISVN